MDIFEAARAGVLDAVKERLGCGFDLQARNPFGFTALHCAVMGCSNLDATTAGALVKTLIDAGADVNAIAKDGRAVLFIAAEFSRSIEPLKLLIAAGANPNIRDAHGNHIVTNARTPEAQELLSGLTGHPIPPPRIEMPAVKLTATEWREAKGKMQPIFDSLAQSGLVVLQDAGTTQEDGFADCAERFRAGDGSGAGLAGFCYYTRQDSNRAKRSGQLSLAFWGAPDGNHEAMERVGKQVVDAFRANGFAVNWNGSSSMRPIVLLQGRSA